MDFSRRKLPANAADFLLRTRVSDAKPYALLSAPVYVFMHLNRKFVSVKGPLDFFTPEDLERYASFESFYFERFLEAVGPFTKGGEAARKLLSSDSESELPPAYYEKSDWMLRILCPLWSQAATIEPFFTTAFAEGLCGPLPESLLISARESDAQCFERSVLCSSWAVFLACHLGFVDLSVLRGFRRQVFAEQSGQAPRAQELPADPLVQLRLLAKTTFELSDGKAFAASAFFEQANPLVIKIRSRIERMQGELAKHLTMKASIFGPGGFIDAA